MRVGGVRASPEVRGSGWVGQGGGWRGEGRGGQSGVWAGGGEAEGG